MKVGIVGSEAAKFTPSSEQRARAAIRELLRPGDVVISGACHLGGIDKWAIEEGKEMGLRTVEYPPANLQWSTGYKPRNERIAINSDLVVCLTVDKLPPGYTGMRFPLCYHCKSTDHVKSGGCWTVKFARSHDKPGKIIVINTDD